MDISYLGHSSFKLKFKSGTVVTDPFDSSVGFSMASVSADLVTVSHDHFDHNNVSSVSGTARRDNPFIINEPGEYEVEGVSVFGYPSFHDDKKGSERGENNIFVIQGEGIRVVHLGDLGHSLSEKFIEKLDGVDILLVPVGGHFTIDSKIALSIIETISPSIAIPMHYRTSEHNSETFKDITDLDTFINLYGGEVRKVEDKLTVNKLSLSEDQTEVYVF